MAHGLLIQRILRYERKYVIKPQNKGASKGARQKDALGDMVAVVRMHLPDAMEFWLPDASRSLQPLARHPAAIFIAASGILLMSTLALLPP